MVVDVTVEVAELGVVLVEESVLLSLPPHATVSVLKAIVAAIPTATEKRRCVRLSVMVTLDS